MNEQIIAINRQPDWKSNAVPTDVGSLLPSERFGKPVEWLDGAEPHPVFITQFRSNPPPRDVYLFGCRLDLTKMRSNGTVASDGFFIQFVVLEYLDPTSCIAHKLRQHRSPIYSVNSESKDWVWAADLSDSQLSELSMCAAPVWNIEEAQWPTVNGSLMHFVGQANLPLNEVTKAHLTWKKDVFLFQTPGTSGSVFKIFAQDIKAP